MATRLYRPTLHQIYALHWHHAGLEEAFACVGEGLQHVGHAIEAPAAQELQAQLEAARRRGLHPRDARAPLVRSDALYPVPGEAPLRAAFLAYQDGTALLIHLIWHWDGEGDETTFRQLCTRRWDPQCQGAPGELGEGWLLTAALQEPVADELALARKILSSVVEEVGTLTRLPLTGAALYVPARRPLYPAPWPAVLLFESPEVERSRAADRLVTLEWPLVVLYHLRVERVYFDRYRPQVVPQLIRHGPALRRALETTFTPLTDGTQSEGEPALLARRHVGELQRALTRLSGPQYALLKAISDAERCAHDARRDLRNLEEAVRSALSLPLKNTPSTAADVERSIVELLRPARHYVAQMETDATEARTLAERVARAVDVLRTQADIIEADYERRLNWVIGLVGTAIAMAQLVDQHVARVVARTLYELGLQRLLTRVGIALPPPDSDGVILLVRGLAVLLSLLLVGAFLRFYLRPRRS